MPWGRGGDGALVRFHTWMGLGEVDSSSQCVHICHVPCVHNNYGDLGKGLKEEK